MPVMKSSRFGALILNVYISLNLWLAASASIASIPILSTSIALVSPNSGSANASISTSQISISLVPTSTIPTLQIASSLTSASSPPIKGTSTLDVVIASSLSSTSSLPIHGTSTSDVTTASTLITSTTKSSLSQHINAVSTVTSASTPVSLASHDPSSSATESSVAMFTPSAPPSNAHIAKLAEAIVPSVVGGAGIGVALWKFFGKLAESQPGESAASVAQSLERARKVRFVDELSPQGRDWVLLRERRILMAQNRKPPILDEEQVRKIRAMETGGESIWNGMGMPSLSEPCPGHPFCIDWPGSSHGSAPPSAPEPPSDPGPPPGQNPPSTPNPPGDPNPPAGPDPPPGQNPPSTPNTPADPIPPSDPNPPTGPDPPPGQNPPSAPDPPSDPIPPSDPNPPTGPDPPFSPPPSGPPPPATEESIRLANELPPLPEAINLPGRFGRYGPVRLVPDAYRTLPLDAKVVYAIKYGEDVWSQRLRFFKGGETAAVDAQNKPLKDWNFDKNGDLVEYQGKTADDIKKEGLPKGVDKAKFSSDYVHTSAEISRLEDMEDVERDRVEEADPPPEPPEPTPTPPPPEPTPTPPPPEPTPEPEPEPEPTPTPTPPLPPPPPPPPPPPLPEDHKNHPHHLPDHHPKHHNHHKLKGGQCMFAWNWAKC